MFAGENHVEPTAFAHRELEVIEAMSFVGNYDIRIVQDRVKNASPLKVFRDLVSRGKLQELFVGHVDIQLNLRGIEYEENTDGLWFLMLIGVGKIRTETELVCCRDEMLLQVYPELLATAVNLHVTRHVVPSVLSNRNSVYFRNDRNLLSLLGEDVEVQRRIQQMFTAIVEPAVDAHVLWNEKKNRINDNFQVFFCLFPCRAIFP